MFVGREKELRQLDELRNKVTKTSLVTVRGRRRIGKSTLIEHFADKRLSSRELIDMLFVTGDRSENRVQMTFKGMKGE